MNFQVRSLTRLLIPATYGYVHSKYFTRRAALIVVLLCLLSLANRVLANQFAGQQNFTRQYQTADKIDKDSFKKVADYDDYDIWTHFTSHDHIMWAGIVTLACLSLIIIALILNSRRRHQVERELRTEKHSFQMMVENAPQGIIIVSKEGDYLYVNPKFVEMFGYNLDSAPNGREWFRKAFPDKAARHRVVSTWLSDAAQSDLGPLPARIFNVTCKDGTEKNINFRAVKLRTGAHLVTCEDITAHMEIQRALEESEEKYRKLVEVFPHTMAILQDGKVVFVNPAALKTFGFESMEQAIGSNMMNHVAESEKARLRQYYTARYRGESWPPEHYRTFLKKVDGTEFPVEVFVKRIDFRGKRAEQILVIDITERYKAEEALAAEKERLSVTLRSIGDAVISSDINRKIVLMNKAAEELTGWTQAEAFNEDFHKVFQIIDERTRDPWEDPVKEVIETGRVFEIRRHAILLSRNGAEKVITGSAAPIHDSESKVIGVVIVFRDITEKQRTEKELQRVEKLESIGILAGGIAHDFNNIITAILGNIDLALLFSSPGTRVAEKLTAAKKACQRARDLTQQLLTFSKGGAPIKKTASVSDLIRESVKFPLMGSNVSSELSIPDDLWHVEVDEGQMNQVISNLMINSVQAMPNGGTIVVYADNLSLTEKSGIPLPAGDYVRISVTDTGMGIPREHLPKIFDPYFTTKKQGSGLGLATVYSIIKNHGGHVCVESEVGAGTVVDIYLPASKKQAHVEKKGEPRMVLGKGKVLLMDDDETIRDLAGDLLKILGYEVEFAEDGLAAIQLYKKAMEAGNPFDVVIMDLTVPGGMGGREAIKKLIELDPQVKAVVSSGYSNDPIMANFREYGFKGVVAKPYNSEDLSTVLHNVISGS